MHILDADIFKQILDAVTFMHILDADVFMHILDAVIFMHILDADILMHILDAVYDKTTQFYFSRVHVSILSMSHVHICVYSLCAFVCV